MASISTTGITIKNLLLSDKEVRIVSLLVYGLGYDQIERCTEFSNKAVRVVVSGLYNRLQVFEVHALTRYAIADGFDYYGHVHGKDVLTATDRTMIAVHVPHLKNEKAMPHLVYQS